MHSSESVFVAREDAKALGHELRQIAKSMAEVLLYGGQWSPQEALRGIGIAFNHLAHGERPWTDKPFSQGVFMPKEKLMELGAQAESIAAGMEQVTITPKILADQIHKITGMILLLTESLTPVTKDMAHD